MTLITVLLLTVQGYASPTKGKWSASNGTVSEIPCPDEYGDVTMLAQGCVLRLSGGGLLYTKAADAAVYGEMDMASKMVSGLKVEISTCTSTLERIRLEHLSKIKSLSESALLDISKMEDSHKAEMVSRTWTAVSVGFSLGAALLIAFR